MGLDCKKLWPCLALNIFRIIGCNIGSINFYHEGHLTVLSNDCTNIPTSWSI